MRDSTSSELSRPDEHRAPSTVAVLTALVLVGNVLLVAGLLLPGFSYSFAEDASAFRLGFRSIGIVPLVPILSRLVAWMSPALGLVAAVTLSRASTGALGAGSAIGAGTLGLALFETHALQGSVQSELVDVHAGGLLTVLGSVLILTAGLLRLRPHERSGAAPAILVTGILVLAWWGGAAASWGVYRDSAAGSPLWPWLVRATVATAVFGLIATLVGLRISSRPRGVGPLFGSVLIAITVTAAGLMLEIPARSFAWGAHAVAVVGAAVAALASLVLAFRRSSSTGLLTNAGVIILLLAAIQRAWDVWGTTIHPRSEDTTPLVLYGPRAVLPAMTLIAASLGLASAAGLLSALARRPHLMAGLLFAAALGAVAIAVGDLYRFDEHILHPVALTLYAGPPALLTSAAVIALRGARDRRPSPQEGPDRTNRQDPAAGIS